MNIISPTNCQNLTGISLAWVIFQKVLGGYFFTHTVYTISADLVEIWFAKRYQSSQMSNVIKPETGNFKAAILKIDMTL